MIKLKLKAKTEDKILDVTLPAIHDLFYVRNLAKKDDLLSIIKVDEQYRAEMPITKNHIRAGFDFRASASAYGQVVAGMEITHPNAENIIKQYLVFNS